MNRRNIIGLEHLTLLATFTPECQGRGRGVLVSCRVPMAVQTPWGLAQSSQKSPGLAEAADNDQAGALGLSGASQSGLRSCLRFAWLVATPTAPTPPYPISHPSWGYREPCPRAPLELVLLGEAGDAAGDPPLGPGLPRVTPGTPLESGCSKWPCGTAWGSPRPG